jgi:hypothetical protein
MRKVIFIALAFIASCASPISPQRIPGELLSVYRIRYARYCFSWLVSLGLGLIVLLLWRPNPDNSPVPLLIMFCYLGFSLGTGVALIAFTGFSIGSGWAAIVENNITAALWWPKIQETLAVVALSPIVIFALYTFITSVITKQVPFFSRRHNHIFFQWNEEPIGFIIMLAIWGAIGGGLAAYLLRRLRKTYAS